MEKRLIFIFIFNFGSIFCSGQNDSTHLSHSAFISIEQWFEYDAHTVYGYQLTNGKNNFEIGISLERKRISAFDYYNRYIFYFSPYYRSFFYPYAIKDTNLSVTINCIKLGYSYVFRPEKRLVGYPFVNFYLNYYRDKGVYEGQLEPSVYGIDHYELKQLQLLLNLGYGFVFKINKYLKAKLEMGIGTSFINSYAKSDYFGLNRTPFQWWVNGYGRLGIYYHF